MNAQVTAGQAPEFRFAVGPGWWPLLDRLHEQLVVLDPDYRLDDVKEKWGGLRITLAHRLDAGDQLGKEYASAMRSVVEAAENASRQTCQVCGQPGRRSRPLGRPGGWVTTRCPTHQR